MWEDIKHYPPFVEYFRYRLIVSVIKHCLYCKQEKAALVTRLMFYYKGFVLMKNHLRTQGWSI